MHNIEFYTYEENVHRDYVQRELNYRVTHETWQEGGHGLYSPIRWLEKLPVYADRVEAEQAINQFDRGDYDNLAVRYCEPISFEKSQKLNDLEMRYKHAVGVYNDRNGVWAHGLKAELVGCHNCGSKIKRDYIKTNNCPVCGMDLRPVTVMKSVNAALARMKKAEQAVNTYKRDHSKKRVMWLVKIEYHT